MNFERLDEVALMCRQGNDEFFGVLSSGEKRYVALAANRADLLKDTGDTIAEAIRLMEPEALAHLLKVWTW